MEEVIINNKQQYLDEHNPFKDAPKLIAQKRGIINSVSKNGRVVSCKAGQAMMYAIPIDSPVSLRLFFIYK